MPTRVARSCAAIVGMLFFAPNTWGALTRIEPFTGSIQESWESFPNVNAPPSDAASSLLTDPTTIFENLATISHAAMGVFEPGSADYSLGSSGVAKVAHGHKGLGLTTAGQQLLPEFVEPASISFITPLHSFGGYWGAATGNFVASQPIYLIDPEVIDFQFFDTAGILIGSDSLPYSRSFLINYDLMIFRGDGELQWAGWEFDYPVERIVFSGGFIVADFLQANPIPEPSTGALFLLLGMSLIGYLRLPRSWRA